MNLAIKQARGIIMNRYKSIYDKEVFIFIAAFFGIFFLIGHKMGVVNMMNTLMNTAYDLLINTVFYIMGVAVLAGAVGALLSEFGVIALFNQLLSRIVGKIYDLPGASVIGIFTTYLSDNPAILSLAEDHSFISYFKKYQLPALTNLGTAFGMGMIITTYMIGLSSISGESYVLASLVGNIGAVIGSIVSVRLMLHFTKKKFGTQARAVSDEKDETLLLDRRMIRDGNVGNRFMQAMLDGGKAGVSIGLDIIPGVVIVCSLVMILSNGPTNGVYTGAANEGIALLPWIGDKLSFIIQPLFGFSSSKAIAVPITSLGAAGAAIGLVPSMIREGIVHANDIAVFTAMCMCWSGYLSTHVGMLDKLGYPKLINSAILSHTIGGIVAGISANLIFQILALIL